MPMRISMIVLLFACCAVSAPGLAEEYKVEVPRPPRKGKPQSPAVGHLWVPSGVDQVRGLVISGKVLLEKKLYRSGTIRKAAADKKLGLLYFEPHIAATFNYATTDCEDNLLLALKKLAEKTGRPEIETVPWLTIGHSTGGIYCRNVAFWKPERTIGVLHIKSGNFQDGIQDISASLAGVPFLAINGEFERFGPAGGDLGMGLRARYSLNEENKKKKNQTQWVMIRMQIMERRKKDPDNLMSLVVDRDHGHSNWGPGMTELSAQFIRAAADARIPDKITVDKPVECKKLTAEDGWLSDPDIKEPKHEPAPYAQYTGDKRKSFWHVDETMAKAVHHYHAKEWSHPDPTAGQSDEERYTPPGMLRDKIDSPPPEKQVWKGGDGVWDQTSADWVVDGSKVATDDSRQAVFSGQAGTVKLADGLKKNRLYCNGLQLGPGYVLDLGTNQLRVNWHAELADDSTVRMTLVEKDRKRRWHDGKLAIGGNAKLGGTLEVHAEGELRDAKYRVVTLRGLVGGDFSRVIPPDGYTGTYSNGVLELKKK
jgi:hypothetical protein